MKNSIKMAATAAFILSAGGAFAAPVDLSTWTAEGGGNWNLAADNNSVFQSVNGAPTVFYNGVNSQGTSLSGSIEVQTSLDDDFIGFVLGYDTGELNSASADFWLIDWKQNTQTFSGATATAGLSLSQVLGDTRDNSHPTSIFPDIWDHTGVVDEVVRATNLGSTGWADNTVYSFELTFTASLIEVFVDGVLEISFAGAFGDGSFGFYNYSQQNVEYAGIQAGVLPPDPSPVPLPASLPILLAALGAMGVVARKRKS